MISDIPHASTLTDLQIRKLMKLFSMYDADNTGILKAKNFQTLINRLADLRHWKPDSAEYARLQTKFMHRWMHIRAEIKDQLKDNKDGSVTLQEWLLFYERVLSNASYKEHINEVTNLIFDAVDIDANETLSLPEWQQLFQVYGIPVIYAGEAFASIALNGAHYLSKPEVLQRVMEFYYSTDPEAPGNFMFGPI